MQVPPSTALCLCFECHPPEELHLSSRGCLRPSLQTLNFPKCYQFKTGCSRLHSRVGILHHRLLQKTTELNERPFLKIFLTYLAFKEFSLVLSSVWVPASQMLPGHQDPPLPARKLLFISSVPQFRFLSASSSSSACLDDPFSRQTGPLRQLVFQARLCHELLNQDTGWI